MKITFYSLLELGYDSRMRKILGVVTLAASLLCLLLASTSSEAALAGPDLPIGWSESGGQFSHSKLSQLGPIAIGSDSHVSARKMRLTFGKPSRTRSKRGSCQRYWRKYGVTAWFSNLGGARKPICKQNYATLQWLSITGAAGVDWHTNEGLRLGDSLTRLSELYPESQRFIDEGRFQWSLSPVYVSPFGESHETADVMARSGADGVAAFDIWVGGAGE